MDVGAFLPRIGWGWFLRAFVLWRCYVTDVLSFRGGVGWGNNIQSVANFLSRILRRFWCYVVTKTSHVDCWTWHLGNVLNQTCNTGCTTREWKKPWTLEFALDIDFMHFHGPDNLSTDGERTVLCICIYVCVCERVCVHILAILWPRDDVNVPPYMYK